MLGGILLVVLISTGPGLVVTGPPIITGAIGTVLVSAIAVLLPWQRLRLRWLMSVAIIDVLIIALLRSALSESEPGLSILVLIPTLWLAYTFGIAGVVVAIISDYLVALLPSVLTGAWPHTPSAWGSATLIPAVVSGVSIVVYLAARHINTQQNELRRAHDELTASVQRQHDSESTALAVINNAGAGITFYDETGTILLTNATARALVLLAGGATTNEVSPSLLVFEEDRTTPVPSSEQVVARAGRGDMESGKIVWVGAGPNQRAVRITSRHVLRSSGELIGTLVTSQDVTELKEALDARDEFLRTISHELRTPLASVIGYLELIEDSIDLERESVAQSFGIIQRNSQRLLSLINSLITEAHGRPAPIRLPVSVADIAATALDRASATAAKAGITVLATRVDEVTAELDAGEIGEVLDQLLSNAIKFTERGGTVSLGVVREGAEVVIRVEDTGMGIPDDERSHIFERFFRGAAAREAVIAGTGLGLSTVKQIVDTHTGTIRPESIRPHGTAMVVRLPLEVRGSATLRSA